MDLPDISIDFAKRYLDVLAEAAERFGPETAMGLATASRLEHVTDFIEAWKHECQIAAIRAEMGMTDDEAFNQLQVIIETDDTELGHLLADRLLCELLRQTHPRTVAAFEDMTKWYSHD